MAASEDILGALHNKVAEVLCEALEGQELPDYVDPDTEEVVKGGKLAPSAAIIAAATKFLKDNNITCAASEDNALGDLEKKMRERQERRANRANARVVDFDEARKDANFLADRLTGS